ncbi:NAD(P)-binding oxidoreductase [Streptomyces sp. DSM 3412]|uniref:NAD(P)-binding oxidoreductase n=1 Tax=Streptomyces gottesmaniae TaxID=3075518 RepID=A0ABU2YWR2_9ACTN|nr:NAD(P)-binding oxidoreductase [Streptomyces sp. DSM 3412]MDT0568459.1 NAD(P)-binding oxidoreductase [Streptomyces sp. DSM 3412]
MRFLLLGATGATGRLFTDAATAAGHEVVAFVRDPSKLARRERVTAVAGDVRDAEALAEAMRGMDAVVSTLGIGKAKDPANLIIDTTRALVQAAEASGTKRVVVMSAFGVGDSLAKASGILRFLYKGGKANFADKAAGERILTASALDWTLVYPVLLTNKPATTVQAIDLKQLDRLPGVPRISRADVAAFLLSAAAEGSWSRRTAVLTK